MNMPSEDAKKAAGTFVNDISHTLPAVLLWATEECREGRLQHCVQAFCEEQPEIVEARTVIVEAVNTNYFECKLPCRCYDHESEGTFSADIQFLLDPRTGQCVRV